jgi:hypothetical protein
MRWLLPLLLAAILTFAVSLSSAGAGDRAVSLSSAGVRDRAVEPAAEPSLPVPRVASAAEPPLAVPRVACELPRTLRLRRFEDRSARLDCAGRAIVRVSVPG